MQMTPTDLARTAAVLRMRGMTQQAADLVAQYGERK